ncbi:MAG TPA: hypothetical protein VES96_03190 [Nitrospiraceae bacterium]|nr:hypothetical protein [Nitrospiraceae bacterium]
MLILIIMAVIGIGSITLTGLENRLAGFVRVGEAASAAAESCLAASVTVIQQGMANGTVGPIGAVPGLLDNAAKPGPVPSGNKTTLDNEILGAPGFVNFGDTLPATYPNFNIGVPTPNQTLNNFTVQGDIDRLYVQATQGSGMSQFGGYEGTGGGAAGGGIQILYQVNCLSTNAATNARARLTAVYSCLVAGGSCQRKI